VFDVSMDREAFWSLIDESRKVLDPSNVDGSHAKQAEALKAALERLPASDIVAFRNLFRERLDEAHRWDLWGVANLLGDGCTDDGFMDFSDWLISMGRGVFEDALRDPDSLSKFVSDRTIENYFFEGFRSVPYEAYEAVVGRPIPRDSSRGNPGSPAGQRWRDEDELHHMLPKTWAAVTAWKAARKRKRKGH
jgi:hypothetical protein